MARSSVGVRLDASGVQRRRLRVRRFLSGLATVSVMASLSGAVQAETVRTCGVTGRVQKGVNETVWPGCLQLDYGFGDYYDAREDCVDSRVESWVTDDYHIQTSAGAQWVCPSPKPDVRLTIETVVDIHGTDLRAELAPDLDSPEWPWHDSGDYLFVSPTHVIFKRKDRGTRNTSPELGPDFLLASNPYRRLLIGGTNVVVHRWMIATYEWGSGCDTTTITSTAILDPVSL